MRPPKIDFYDPLYDRVTLSEVDRTHGRGLFEPGFAKDQSGQGGATDTLNQEKLLIPFLSTVEFSRQNFLKQSNLAFLVYPSATHTRLAHALGACYLGELASREVYVGERLAQGKKRPPVSLIQFLEEHQLREEFYLALLLHDVGHYPFSHALESDRDFWKAFGREVHHEEVACELILGEGRFYDASVQRVAPIRESCPEEPLHLAALFDRYHRINRQSICYLISGDEKYLPRKRSEKRAELRVLHELVSGLLDLDRVDHYRRDNYFTGIRAGMNLNFPSLLGGITIYYQKAGDNRPQLWLSPFAIGHAISLLLSKERLTEDCFENPHSIAYEVMLHHAFNMYFLGEDYYELNKVGSVPEPRKKEVYDLLASTDEQLLIHMSQNGGARVREIVFRIFNKRPYTPISRLRIRVGHDWGALRSIRKEISRIADVPKTDVVVRVSKNFGMGKPGIRTGEWLDLEQLRNAEGKHLSDSKYKLHIEHFKKAQDKLAEYEQIWLFSTDEGKAKRVADGLPAIREKLGCKSEDL